MKKRTIIGIIVIVLFVGIIIFSYMLGGVGITPLHDYCSGFKVDRKIIHKVLPDAKLKLGPFEYEVDEASSDEMIRSRMEDFKGSIQKGTLSDSEDYWADPYCIGYQYWLE